MTDENLRGAATAPTGHVPPATVERLPAYLRALLDLEVQGVRQVSSTELAEAVGVQSALLRRDLSWLGSLGTRGVGYDVSQLAREIGAQVGQDSRWPVIVVGVGALGRAMARHLGALDRNFDLVALVDRAPDLVGRTVAGVEVVDQDRLEEVVAATGPRIAIITTPAAAAQQVADRLVAAGIRSILNFAPTTLAVADDVTVRRVDLAQELHVLAFHEAHRAADRGVGTEKS